MCGRFTQRYTWQELVALYRLTVLAINLQPRYNIAPTTMIDVIIPRGADRLAVTPLRWGLTPYWWKKTAKEVRAQTVAEKPMFRDPAWSAWKLDRPSVRRSEA
jgi:putative SOS response-associated peptidase YedK